MSGLIIRCYLTQCWLCVAASGPSKLLGCAKDRRQEGFPEVIYLKVFAGASPTPETLIEAGVRKQDPRFSRQP